MLNINNQETGSSIHSRMITIVYNYCSELSNIFFYNYSKKVMPAIFWPHRGDNFFIIIL